MADNKRDIELRIAATTSGSEAIKKLGDDLGALAKEAGSGSDEFVKLRDSVAEIGKQGDAVAVLNQIETQIAETATKFDAASQKVKELSAAIDEQKSAVATAKDNQKQLGDAVETTAKQLRATKAELATYRAESDASDRATAGYKERVTQLRTAIAELQNKLGDQRAEFKAAKQATGEAADELNKLQSAYNASEKAVGRLQTKLDGQNQSLDKARDGLINLGIGAEDSAQAIAAVEAALAGAKAETDRASEAYRKQTEYLNAIAASNERAVQQARAAATARAEAARIAASASKDEEAAALKLRLAQEASLAATAKAIAKSQEAGSAMKEAFGVIGVRSATEIRAEIDRINASLQKLVGNTNVTGEDFDRAFAGAQARIKSLEAELAKVPGAIDKSTQSTSFLTNGFKQLIAVYGGIELATKFVDANVQIESMRRALTLVTGSTETAARQIALLQGVANNAGISIGDISESFIKFQASMNGSKIPLETTEGLFRAIVNASGQLGISSQKTGLMLDALGQIANKGTVSMEELRQQLGDSLPGAMELTAKGLGVTTTQLVKMVENGRLLAVDFLPALRKSLVESFGDGEKAVDGLGASINRFKNTLTQASQAIGESGTGKIIAGTFDFATEAVKRTTFMVEAFTLQLSNAYAKQSEAADALKNGDFERYFNIVKSVSTDADKALVKLAGSLNGISPATIDAAQKLTATGAAVETAAEKFRRLENAANNSTLATQANANAVEDARGKWVQLTKVYDDNLAVAVNQISAAEKIAAAKKIEADSRLMVVKAAGDEQATLQLSAQLSAQEAQALEYVALKRRDEVAMITEQRDKLVALAQQIGDNAPARQEEIEKLNKSIELRTAEAEKATQTAEAMRAESEQRKLQIRLYEDNSKAVDQLRKAYEESSNTLRVMTLLYERGKISLDQLREAETLAARSSALYKDAVGDVVKANELRIKTEQTKTAVLDAQYGVMRQSIQNEIDAAQRMGNTSLILDRQIALKQLDIKVLEAKIKLTTEEIAIERESIRSKIDALDKGDALYEQKKKQLELDLKALEIKSLENKQRLETIRGIQAEIEAMQRRTQGSANMSGSYVKDRQAEADANDRTRDSVDALAAAERKRWATNMNGQKVEAGAETWMSIVNTLQGYGVSESRARAIASEFTDSNGNVQFFNNPGQLKYGGRNSTIGFAIQQAAQQELMNQPASDTGGIAQRTPATQQGSAAKTVNITINGRSQSVTTASSADADALVAVIKQLETAANNATPTGI